MGARDEQDMTAGRSAIIFVFCELVNAARWTPTHPAFKAFRLDPGLPPRRARAMPILGLGWVGTSSIPSRRQDLRRQLHPTLASSLFRGDVSHLGRHRARVPGSSKPHSAIVGYGSDSYILHRSTAICASYSTSPTSCSTSRRSRRALGSRTCYAAVSHRVSRFINSIRFELAALIGFTSHHKPSPTPCQAFEHDAYACMESMAEGHLLGQAKWTRRFTVVKERQQTKEKSRQAGSFGRPPRGSFTCSQWYKRQRAEHLLARDEQDMTAGRSAIIFVPPSAPYYPLDFIYTAKATRPPTAATSHVGIFSFSWRCFTPWPASSPRPGKFETPQCDRRLRFGFLYLTPFNCDLCIVFYVANKLLDEPPVQTSPRQPHLLCGCLPPRQPVHKFDSI